MQTLAKRCFYQARQSSMLRRVAALPIFAGVANAISRRIVPPRKDYPGWIAERLLIRRHQYRHRGEKGLLSFITTVWNTPLVYLRKAADSLLRDQTIGEFEWVVLDNGSTDSAVREFLIKQIATDPRVKFVRVENNLGIIGGMRQAMSQASNRYILPFDSDDTVYHDAVAILTHCIGQHGYPPVLYSDEDKLETERASWPYFKPDWDPVLFVNSCFIAHLGCFDRKLAFELDVYGDPLSEGCHDWDTFLRFMLAGHRPVHIPEMLYSWRMHANSTAGNINSKDFIHRSHRHVLGKYVATLKQPAHFELRPSPLFNGTPDWWFFRKPVDAAPLLSIVLSLDPLQVDRKLLDASTEYPQHRVEIVHARSHPRDVLKLIKPDEEFVSIRFDRVHMTDPHWAWEAVGLFERYSDAVMVGGRVINGNGRIIDGPRVLGFGGLFGCPDRGRGANDPGYSVEMWKQRSVGGVSTHLCIIRVEFLRQILEEFSDAPLSWFFLGAWAAVRAKRLGHRVLYSPFVSGQSDFDLDPGVSQKEMDCFRARCGDALPDARFYSRHFGLLFDQPYLPISELERQGQEKNLFSAVAGPVEYEKVATDRPAPGEDYEKWLENRIRSRAGHYTKRAEAGQFSLLTCVYEHTPLVVFAETVDSVLRQTSDQFEWIVLAHGPIDPQLDAALNRLETDSRIRIFRLPKNLGIIGGMRYCLEKATGRYVVPLDADDLLTADALTIFADSLARRPAAFIYSDEDSLVEGRPQSPYFRPDWDPLLNLASSYIFHLVAFDRQMALGLGIYSDPAANYCHDWDTVFRFLAAREVPMHVPEVVYHWRAHAVSHTNTTEPHQGSQQSQFHLLQQFLGARDDGHLFEIKPFPIFRGAPEWWLQRKHIKPAVFDLVLLTDRSAPELDDRRFEQQFFVDDLPSLRGAVAKSRASFLVFLEKKIVPSNGEWAWEAQGLFELNPDIVLLAGRIINPDNVVLGGPDEVDERGKRFCPYRGMLAHEPGEMALALKPHQVQCPNTAFFLARTDFVQQALSRLPTEANIRFLGPWLALIAETQNKNIGFSPLIEASAAPGADCDAQPSPAEKSAYLALKRELPSA